MSSSLLPAANSETCFGLQRVVVATVSAAKITFVKPFAIKLAIAKGLVVVVEWAAERSQFKVVSSEVIELLEAVVIIERQLVRQQQVVKMSVVEPEVLGWSDPDAHLSLTEQRSHSENKASQTCCPSRPQAASGTSLSPASIAVTLCPIQSYRSPPASSACLSRKGATLFNFVLIGVLDGQPLKYILLFIHLYDYSCK